MQHLQVAVGVIVNAEREILIARRHAHQHQGDLWEFPGGKQKRRVGHYYLRTTPE